MRRYVSILIGIVLIAFGIGIYSLIYYDGFKLADLGIYKVRSNNSHVEIGNDGIQVKDGNSRVNIGWNGIEVRDRDDYVKIGLDGIKVDDGKNKVNIGNFGRWFGITSKDLETYDIDEEKLEDIRGIDSVKVVSSFVDVKLTSEDRNDMRIYYHGTMKSDVVPLLEVERKGSEMVIKLTTGKNSYSVVDSNVILEVIIPKTYEGDYTATTSSGDIYVLDVNGKYIDLTSSSGNISFNKSEANNMKITTSSGGIITKEIIGDLDVTTSSGDIVLTTDNNTGNISLFTSSGDVDVFLGTGSNLSVSGTTSSGDVRSNTPISVHQDKTGRFDFTVGTGEKNMKITTSSGNVYFK